jgi:sugar-specific transcriptional regulator TrmB
MTDYLNDAIKAGLSAKASAVYVALLEAGLALPPKAIVGRTKLHRQYVYDALRELQDKRLIVTEGQGHRIKYGAGSPDRLLQEAEKQRLDALDGVSALMKLYDRSPAGVVEIIRGSRAVVESEFALLKESENGGFLDIVSGVGMSWVRMLEERKEEYDDLRRKKRIKLRYIGTGSDVQHAWEENAAENESRVMSGISDVISVSVRPTSVTFNIYEPEIMAVRVKNLAAVQSQRAIFEVLWKGAQPNPRTI